MKVVYIADMYGEGGAVEALLEMVCYMKSEYQIEAIVLTACRNELGKKLDERGIENYCIGHRQFCYDAGTTTYLKFLHRLAFPYLYIRYRYTNCKAYRKACRVVDFSEVDLIHSNVNRNDIGTILARKHKLPHIWHIREVMEGHFDLHFYRFRPIQYMNRSGSVFLAVSSYVKRYWEKKGLASDRTRILYDSIDESCIGFQNIAGECTKSQEKKCGLRIVFGGQITQEKGQWQLIQALALLSKEMQEKMEVDFFGSVPLTYRTELEKMIADNGISSRIAFHSFTEDYKEQLKTYDIGISASVAEGFGKVTAEYMAAGLCAIGSACGATPEIIKDGETGFLFPYGDVKKLADILEMLYADRKLLEQVAKNGQKYVLNTFSQKIIMKKLMDIYVEAMTKGEA